MTGYTRKDTTNNIADGNIINADDLDNEFDGVQTAFNASTGHTHDGTSAEGAAIVKIGPVQDVVVTISAMYPKTTNTVDLGTSSLKYKDAFIAGNETVGGTLAVTGVATLTAQPVLSSLTASSAVATDASKGLVSVTNTGSGNNVLATSPTLVTPILGTPASGTVTNLTGTASININGTVGATTATTGAFTTLSTSSTVTISGGTANGVAYLNGSKVLTTGTALTFDGTNLGIGTSSPTQKLDVAGSAAITGSTPLYLQRPVVPSFQGQGAPAISWQFYTTGTTYVTGASIQALAADVWSSTSAPTDLVFATVPSGSTTLVTRAVITSSGNLGLGVTPSAWSGGFSGVLEIKNNGSALASGGAGNTSLWSNAYYISGGSKYAANGFAANYTQDSGQHIWNTAGNNTSGAGAAITFTQAMTLDASGNFIVGGTAATNTSAGRGNITLNGSSSAIISIGTGGVEKGYIYTQGTDFILNAATGSLSIQTATAQPIGFGTSGATKMLLDSSGNLGLGVGPSAWYSDYKVEQIGFAGSVFNDNYNEDMNIGSNAFADTRGGYKFIRTGYAQRYAQTNSGQHRWFTSSASGTAGNPITFTQAMTLDASGNLGIGTSSPTSAAGYKFLTINDAGGTNGAVFESIIICYKQHRTHAHRRIRQPRLGGYS